MRDRDRDRGRDWVSDSVVVLGIGLVLRQR